MPTRVNNLHSLVCSQQNILKADINARKNKSRRKSVKQHDLQKDEHILQIQKDLSKCQYKTSQYETFKIYEPKERIIFKLPYYPDRIVHHALMNILEPIWKKIFIKSTYSCIKGRGIHKLLKDLKKDLAKYPDKTVYCLKLDIRKFYPSLDHQILKDIIQKKIKDKYLLSTLYEIIDSASGVPIGNYLSQFFANLYLAYFDHWIKEELKCKFYYRYADDIVILHDNKDFLHNVLVSIKLYLSIVLKLQIKPNYQIFPIEDRGIDFVGYVFRHHYILVRKSIKNKIFKVLSNFNKNDNLYLDYLYNRLTSYKGWLKYCNSKNLMNKIQENSLFKMSNWDGHLRKFPYNCSVYIIEYIIHKRYLEIHYLYKNQPYVSFIRCKQILRYIFRIRLPNHITIYYGNKKTTSME